MSTSTHGQPGPKFGVGITRKRVADLHSKGLNQSEIGRVLGISRAAVQQHIKRLTQDKEIAS